MEATKLTIEEINEDDVQLMEELETVLASGNCGGGCPGK